MSIKEHICKIMEHIDKATPTTPQDSESKTCVACGREFEPYSPLGGVYDTRCEDCNRKRHDILQIVPSRNLTAQWQAVCPGIYQETDFSKIPCQYAFAEALKWEYGPAGLILHGASRTGKSRTAWEVVKRQFMAGKSIRVMGCFTGLEYAAKFNEGADAVLKWAMARAECDLLLMDDAFKGKLTDSFEGAVFSIIDRRCEMQLPVIVCSNDTGPTLQSRMSPDRGAPLVSRLREFCRPIEFSV